MLHDLRYALRNLAASPGFALVAVGSLAVGIALNTTIFTVVNAVLLRPLPVADPSALVDIFTTSETEHATTSWPDFRDLQVGTTAFSGLIGHSLMFANVAHDGRSRLVLGEVVTANYFQVLGVDAARGRTFTPDEGEADGGNRVAILSDGFWRSAFGADPEIVGKPINVRGSDYTIVGVAPATFSGMTAGLSPDLWVPVSMVGDVEPVGMQDVVPSPTGNTRLQRRGQRWMWVKGRLNQGVSIAEAGAQVAATMARLAREHPQTNHNRRGVVVPTSDIRVHPLVDGALVPGGALLMGAASLVLVIACANIANMLLARATARTREIAIRLAIGAGRARLVRQLLVESLALGVLGGLTGLLMARWTTGVIATLPLPMSIALDVRPDWRVFGFAMAMALVTGAIFGLAPALQATRPDLLSALKNDGATPSRRSRGRLRQALVVGQVAVCFVLLAGAGLLIRSLAASRTADLGFQPAGLAVATVDLTMHRYSADRGREFYRQALERLSARPEVASAALTERLPFSPNMHAQSIFIDGRPYGPDERGTVIDVTRVTEGYFKTLGIPLLQGRNFDERDTPSSTGVVIVNETMAQRYWPGESAIGKRIRIRAADGPLFEVVGVAAGHKVRTVGEAPRPFVHFSRNQVYNPSATFLVRSSGGAAALVRILRDELTALEPTLVFLENQTMTSAIALTLLPARMSAIVVGCAGGIALLLAAIGLYGVIAFSVSRRTREIGIRIALGSRPERVLALVLRQGMALVLIGLFLGVLAALPLGSTLGSMFYGINAVDPLTFAGAATLLIGVALAANLIPARRAARVDPIIALRDA